MPIARLVARFRVPIESAALPTDPNLYPEAPRDYEIRVLDSYLGDGLTVAAVLRAYARALQ